MKNQKSLYLLLLGALIALCTGCTRQAESDVESTYQTGAANVQEGVETTGQWFAMVWEEVSEFTVNQRDAFMRTMNRSASRINAEAESLAQDTENVSEETVQTFREASSTLEQRLDDAGEATEDNWEKAKRGVQNAWDATIDAYQDLRAEATS